MNKLRLFSILILATFIQNVFGQAPAAVATIGPTNVYVSKQGNNPDPISTGTYNASADEGRKIQGKVYDIAGPIKVDPIEFDLTGPPCPTYDIHGNRIPAAVQPPNTATFRGTVSLDRDNIPDAGTTVDASFKGKDFGFETHCAAGVQVPYNFLRNVTYKIVSIQMTFAAADNQINMCKDEVYRLRVNSLYPADKGTVTWASANGKVTLANGDNTGVTITANSGGNDFIIATFTVERATYVVRVPVKIFYVKFTDNPTIVYWYNGGTVNAKDFLTDASSKDDLQWDLSLPAGRGTATIDRNTGAITFPTAPGGTYNLNVTMLNAKDCPNNRATTKVIFLGYKIVLDVRRNPCDGEEAGLHLECVPNTVPRAKLNGFMPIQLTSTPKQAFNGNEAGVNALDFAAFDANFRSKVLNCYWYKTVGCNTWSQWEITAPGTVNGNATDATTKPLLTVSIQYQVCIEGSAAPVQTFTGLPVTFTAFNPNTRVWNSSVVGVGTLTRDPIGAVTTFKCPANSQFFNFVRNEEVFHTHQIDGTQSNLCNPYWRVENVMAMLAGRVWWGVTPQIAAALSAQACLIAINIENMRGMQAFVYPSPARCAIEAEAKQNTGIQFGFHMRCAYPLCN